jgi:DNA replication protein DnaC
MSYNKQNASKILSDYAQRPQKALAASTQKKQEIYQKIPEIKNLDEKISLIGFKYFAQAQMGSQGLEERLAKLKEENLSLRKIRGELLKANGYPEDYTNVKFKCSKCNDTGYCGMDMCSCLKDELIKAGYESSGLSKLLQTQSFESFSLEHYSKERDPKSGYSDYQVMKGILDRCRFYAKDFALQSDSLLFVGATGLGKTHLSSAVAKEVISKGYDVVYETAPNILSAFEKERFLSAQELSTDKYFECDLLIVDDLGAEYQGKNSVSIIYNLINTRLVSKKPMIISTNLGYKALESQYDQRIISRLFGEFCVMLFEGSDLRRKNI